MPQSASFPRVEIQIRIGSLKAHVSAMVDTGFGGGILLPLRERDKLGTRDGFTNLRLANDDRITVELFQAMVGLKDREMIVRAVVSGSEFVVGREVLNHFRVCFDHGKSVEIED